MPITTGNCKTYRKMSPANKRQYFTPLLLWTLAYLVAISTPPSADAAITFNGAKCGTKFCSVAQYCNHEKQCEECVNICDNSHHNFDLTQCTQLCQDYLHDSRYARASTHSDELSRLQGQMNLILVLLVLVLAILVVGQVVRLTKWCRGRGLISGLLRKLKRTTTGGGEKSGKMAPEDLTHANPHTQSPKVQLRNVPLRTPGGGQNHQINRESTVFSIDCGASTIHTVSTPISTRYPAEDTAMPFSYDNAALAITPTIPERPKTDSVGF